MEHHASAAAYVPSYGLLSSLEAKKQQRATARGSSSRAHSLTTTPSLQPERGPTVGALPTTSASSSPALPSCFDGGDSLESSTTRSSPALAPNSSTAATHPSASSPSTTARQAASGRMHQAASTSLIYVPSFARASTGPRGSTHTLTATADDVDASCGVGGVGVRKHASSSSSCPHMSLSYDAGPSPLASISSALRPPAPQADSPAGQANVFSLQGSSGGIGPAASSPAPPLRGASDVDDKATLPREAASAAAGGGAVAGELPRGAAVVGPRASLGSPSPPAGAIAAAGNEEGEGNDADAPPPACASAAAAAPHHVTERNSCEEGTTGVRHGDASTPTAPPPSIADLAQQLQRLTSSRSSSADASSAAPTAKSSAYPILMPVEDMKFIFATLTWNVDLLLILLSNAPNPVELTEQREEAETAAIRAIAAAERERKKRAREHSHARLPNGPRAVVGGGTPPLAPNVTPRGRSDPHCAVDTQTPQQPVSGRDRGNVDRHHSHRHPHHHGHDGNTCKNTGGGDAWTFGSGRASPLIQPPQRGSTTWSERLARKHDEEAEEDDSRNSEEHLRAVMSLPTLSDLEKLTAQSPSMRPSVLEARKHHQLNMIARANANFGWDTHNLLSLSDPAQMPHLRGDGNSNNNEEEEGEAGDAASVLRERRDLSRAPWVPPSSMSDVSTTTASTATAGSPSLRLLCGVDSQNFPTLEEVEQWFDKGSLRASAASFWRRLQEHRQRQATGGGGIAGLAGGDRSGSGSGGGGGVGRGRSNSSSSSFRDGGEGSVDGADRVRRNRTFCFAATAATTTVDDDEDGNTADDDTRSERQERVERERRSGGGSVRWGAHAESSAAAGGCRLQSDAVHRPPRLQPATMSALGSPSSCALSQRSSPTVSSTTTWVARTPATTPTSAQAATAAASPFSSKRPPPPLMSPSAVSSVSSPPPPPPPAQPTAAPAVRRHPSTDSLLSLLSSNTTSGGGGPQHQDSRKVGKKSRGGRQRQHGGRTMKIYVSSITEGPKAHLLYTAPTAEADQLYERLLRLRQQHLEQRQQQQHQLGSAGAGGARVAPPTSSTTGAAKSNDATRRDERRTGAGGTLAAAATPASPLLHTAASGRHASRTTNGTNRTTTTSSTSGGVAVDNDETEELKKRRVMALLLRGAESLRFQPWEIPASLLRHSGDGDGGGGDAADLPGRHPPSSAPFLAGAKLAFRPTYASVAAATAATTPPARAAAAAATSRVPSHEEQQLRVQEGEHALQGQRRQNAGSEEEDSREMVCWNEEGEECADDTRGVPTEASALSSLLFQGSALAANVDMGEEGDSDTLAVAAPHHHHHRDAGGGFLSIDGEADLDADDDDDVSTLNESEEPLFPLPARIGRRQDSRAAGSKADRFYFYGARSTTMPRSSSNLTLTPSTSTSNMAAPMFAPSRAAPNTTRVAPVGDGKSPPVTYSAVVRGAGEAGGSRSGMSTPHLTTTTMTATTTSNNKTSALSRTHAVMHGHRVAATRHGAVEEDNTRRPPLAETAPPPPADAQGSNTMGAPTTSARGDDGIDCGTDRGSHPTRPTAASSAAAAARRPTSPEEERRKADTHAFVRMFFRAFFVLVVAQIRLRHRSEASALPTPPAALAGEPQPPQPPPLDHVEVRALLFLRRHFLSFKEVVVKYVMRSEQEVVRRSAQALFGCDADLAHAQAAQEEGGRDEDETRKDVGVESAKPSRHRTAPSLLSSPMAPSYRDAVIAPPRMRESNPLHHTPTTVAIEPLSLDEGSAATDEAATPDQHHQSHTRQDREDHSSKTAAPASAGVSPPSCSPVDLLLSSKLLHAVLSTDNVTALHTLSDQCRSREVPSCSVDAPSGGSTGEEARQGVDDNAESAAFCETDDVEPLAIDQLYLSGKDAAWQPLLLDVLGITRVLQCYPESTAPPSQRAGGTGTAWTSSSLSPCVAINVGLPPLGGVAGPGAASPHVNVLVPHQQVVLGALKVFLLQQPTPSQVYADTDDNEGDSLSWMPAGGRDGSDGGGGGARITRRGNDVEESEAYLRYLLPFLGQPEPLQGNVADGPAAGGFGSQADPSFPYPASSRRGLLDPLHWIPYAFMPSPYSTATSNYSTELHVARLPVSGKLLYRWVVPAEDTDKYNLSVFFQSSLFSFLQGGPLPAPTTDSGFFIDFQQQQQQQRQQQQQAPLLWQHGEAAARTAQSTDDAQCTPLAPQESTLIHCSAGMHRSCGMAIAFILWLLYQCTQLSASFLRQHARPQPQQRGHEAAGASEEGAAGAGRGAGSVARHEALPAAAPAEKDGLVDLMHLLQALLHQPRQTPVAAGDTDYRSNAAMMADASEVLLRTMRHVKRQRSMAEPIATVQFLLKHFAAELQLP